MVSNNAYIMIRGVMNNGEQFYHLCKKRITCQYYNSIKMGRFAAFFVAEISCWLLYNNADNYFFIGRSLQGIRTAHHP